MAKRVDIFLNCAVEEVMDKVANDLLCADKLGRENKHMTIKHPITGERTGYFDENATALKAGDTVELFGQNGTVTFDGIIFQNGVPWEASRTRYGGFIKAALAL